MLCRFASSDTSRHPPRPAAAAGRRERGWANGPSDSARGARGAWTLLVLLYGLTQLLVELRIADLDRLGRGDPPDPLERLGTHAVGK